MGQQNATLFTNFQKQPQIIGQKWVKTLRKMGQKWVPKKPQNAEKTSNFRNNPRLLSPAWVKNGSTRPIKNPFLKRHSTGYLTDSLFSRNFGYSRE